MYSYVFSAALWQQIVSCFHNSFEQQLIIRWSVRKSQVRNDVDRIRETEQMQWWKMEKTSIFDKYV